MNRMTLFTVALVFLAGCAGPVAGQRAVPAYQLDFAVRSEAPEPYVVLAGPIETYQRVPVVRLVREALEPYRARGSKGLPVVRADVTIVAVDSGYREVGKAPRVRPVRVASLGAAGSPGLAGDVLEDGDLPIPEEIHESVTIRARVHLSGPGGASRAESLRAGASRVIRQEDIDRWAYDYEPLFRRAADELARQVDALARSLLGMD